METEDSENSIKLIGYGTFLIRSAQGESIFNVIGTVTIKNFIRIYHPKFQELGIFYPFAVPTKKNSILKALMYKVSAESLCQLDFYEGVPELFKRITCNAILSNGDIINAQIYTPTESTCCHLKEKLRQIMTDEEIKEMWQKDLWLKCLEEQYQLVKNKYPSLFNLGKE
ncbi:MAG: gamma-glutamylcyclotransferase family protein [Candidatus Helarchaeota archaeon]